jgi:hypothetical protein
MSLLRVLTLLAVPAFVFGQSQAPSLFSISPNSAPAGSQGFQMTVNGSGFCFQGVEGASTVLWNGSALQTTFVTTNQLIATVPSSLLTLGGTALVTVVNSGGCFPQGSSNSLNFTIQASLVIQPDTLPDATAGRPYSIRFLPNGGLQPYTWQAFGLPSGFLLDAATGVLSGTPTDAGSIAFSVQLRDATGASVIKNYSLLVRGAPLEFVTTTLPNANIGDSYDQPIQVTGGTKPYSWFISEGQVPGLVLNQTLGRLQGSPTQTGTFRIVVQVRDADGTVISRPFNLTVDPPKPTFQPSFLPNGQVSVPYSATFTGQGGTPPYTFNITSGSVPGLTLNSSGAYTGTPTQTGTYFITVEVRDANGVRNSRTLQVVITGASLTIPAQTLPNGITGVAYSATLQATGATGITWSIPSGSLPPGLTLDPQSGQITGTPTTAGTFNFTASAAAGSQTASRDLSITINEALSVTTTSLPSGRVGDSYLQTLAASGGTSPYTWSILQGGSLPAGLTLDAATGRIAGTPTTAGSSAFQVQVTDAQGRTASRSLSITVSAAISITTTSIPNGVVGSAYSTTLAATGGTGQLTWSATGLPAGLTINASTGAISGTPTTAGSFTPAVTVRDANNATANRSYTLSVTLPPGPSITYPNVPGTSTSNRQVPISVSSSTPYPTDLTGVVTLTFQPQSGSPDDPAIQFTSGGRTANFTIPAGQTAAGFNPANPNVQTGTTAGTIVLTSTYRSGSTDVTPSPAPTQRIVIDPAVPVITNVTLVRGTGTIEVRVTGFSNTRQLDRGLFRFTASSGNTLQTSDFTVQLNSAFATWYGSSQSNQFGTQFLLTMPFTISGDVNAITSVSVTLTNSRGDSTAVSSQ